MYDLVIGKIIIVTFGSVSSNKEGFFGRRGPRSASFTVTIRPSWDGMRLLPSNPSLEHFNNGGVDGKCGSNSSFLDLLARLYHGTLHLELLKLFNSGFGDLRDEGRTGVEGVGDLLKLKLTRTEANNLRFSLF